MEDNYVWTEINSTLSEEEMEGEVTITPPLMPPDIHKASCYDTYTDN